MYIERRSPIAWILWTVLTAVWWGANPYIGFGLRSAHIDSLGSVVEITWQLCVNGIGLGLGSGLVQWLALHVWRGNSKRWFWLTLPAYAIGLPLGFIVVTLAAIVSLKLQGGLLQGEGGTLIISMPLALAMLVSGVFIACLQWAAAREFNADLRKSHGLLWVAASALAWGGGFWAAAYMWTTGWGPRVVSLAAGALVASLTGAALWLVSGQPRLQAPKKKIAVI